MATNLTLDDNFIDEAVAAGHHRPKKAAVTTALQEHLKVGRRLRILDWMGKVDYYDDYDHKQLRQ